MCVTLVMLYFASFFAPICSTAVESRELVAQVEKRGGKGSQEAATQKSGKREAVFPSVFLYLTVAYKEIDYFKKMLSWQRTLSQ